MTDETFQWLEREAQARDRLAKEVKMARVEIDLPWDLEAIEFTDDPIDSSNETFLGKFRWLATTQGGIGDDEMGRICLAAGLLKQKFPNRPFPDCLEQAIIWERG